MEIVGVKTFVTMLPEKASPVTVGSASSSKPDAYGSVARAFSARVSGRNRYFVNRVNARTNKGEKPVGRFQKVVLNVNTVNLDRQSAFQGNRY